jgi:hypothetical protein
MKFLLDLSTAASLLLPASTSAWQDTDAPAYSYDNSQSRGRHDASGNTSGDGHSDLQFDVHMRGSGDTDAYIYGTLGKGWDDVQIHRYDNSTLRSDHMRNYRPYYRDQRRPSYEPGYGPDYYRQYPGRHAEQPPGQYQYPGKFPGQPSPYSGRGR